ncbi:class I SAM-dependent methyltransferase [uncultured Desulfosarcina sp.]|uniref:class I SAM-dependent methyltransferase n=1 Tax=uncultured Desulfosarcina sp. TaxID=218289 RepID=UPI0029C93F13|nr:class I SAM-dependent methyltransferase [uncultured Desulfosarcina sp.]
MDSTGNVGSGDNVFKYLMENGDETHRLEMKTDPDSITAQARWAGIKPGMRVADVGCGPGMITALLHRMASPNGTVVGIDNSSDRIQHAADHYGGSGISFKCRNILDPLDDLGTFDFVLIRFVLEYYRSRSFDIVSNITRIVKPGGILCLIDLDHNCLNQYGIPSRLKKVINSIMAKLGSDADFDPHMGIKLYSMLYDLDYQFIDVTMNAHHLIFGELDHVQDYDWTKKVEVAAKNCGYGFEEYEDGYDGFYAEFKSSFADPRRFIYTPVICCRGVRTV